MTAIPADRAMMRVKLACKIYQARLEQSLFFTAPLFRDPSLDTLLAAYVFDAAGRQLSAGDLCQVTLDTSEATALRVQRRLVDLKLFHRVEHETDRRRLMVELTEEGRRRLEDYLDHLLQNHLVPVSQLDRAECERILASLREEAA